MRTLGKISEKPIEELGYLILNCTGFYQPNNLYFVQIDDEHSIDSDGSIFQIWAEKVNDDDLELGKKEFQNKFGFTPLLIYKGESGTLYNYAEDSNDLKGEDLIFFEERKKDAAQAAEDLFDHNK